MKDIIDLRGKICPYPVVEFVRTVDAMISGDILIFMVDDPLAVKSIPEEMEEYKNIELTIDKNESHWDITVKKLA
jgi:TusA-related sulfurtransferase